MTQPAPSAPPGPAAGGPARVAAVVTLVLALAGFVVAALLPVYSGSTAEMSGDPVTGAAVRTTETTATLAQVNGPGILVVLALPVVVAALPLLARRARGFLALRVTTAVLLVLMTLLGALSVGILFAPAAVAAVVAAALPGMRAAPAAPSTTAQPA
ncbi:hypothetical protein [Isoptericola sp. NPDC057559]|uniref:hypothetical protein n=1 Tax=Isoptericola sp. NPDC057559 TaxID=3346168 RepID=UPI0036A0DB36